MVKISAIIITYNEEENIKDCLESIKWVDEIVIVDSFSKDRTVEICKNYTDKIIKRKWEGYGFQKQFALENASLDWILSIDADERVSKSLKEEIISLNFDKDAYAIPREFYWLGRKLNYGGCKRDLPIRLFRKDKANFTKSIIHEKLKVRGEIGYLKNSLQHFSYKNIEDYFHKFNLFSTLEAKEKNLNCTNIYFIFQILVSIFDFFTRYLIKLGFLDGIEGFLWASFSSFHRLVKYAKLWELSNKNIN